MKTIQVKVKPRAKTSALERMPDDTWLAHLKSPPVDGKANSELIELVSEEFDCPKSSVVIKSGKSSRLKLVQISE